MKQIAKAFSVTVIAIVLCTQVVSAYEFVGTKIALNENTYSPNWGNYAWSADGKYIIEQDSGIFYKIPLDGGEIEVLFDNGDRITQFKITLTPDGNGITYATQNDDYSNSIYTTNLETLETELIVDPGACPVWSPDGRYLLYIVDTDEGNQCMLYDSISGESEMFGPSESIDGMTEGFFPAIFDHKSEYVYYIQMYDAASKDEPATYEIVRRPVHGGETEILSDRYIKGESVFCCNFSLSLDKKWLLFQDTSDVLLLDISSSIVYNALTDEEYTEPRQVPSRISYSKESGEYKLDDVSVDPETDMYFQYCKPAFTPDGRQFVYCVDSHVNFEEYDGTYIVDFSHYSEPEPKSEEPGPLAVDDNQPEAYATLANFPNPFNPSTTIEFMLPESGSVKLVIYDITGRKVRELISGQFSAGKHSIQWNACDDAGKPVSSGVYVSRLENGDAAVTNRMTLVR